MGDAGVSLRQYSSRIFVLTSVSYVFLNIRWLVISGYFSLSIVCLSFNHYIKVCKLLGLLLIFPPENLNQFILFIAIYDQNNIRYYKTFNFTLLTGIKGYIIQFKFLLTFYIVKLSIL